MIVSNPTRSIALTYGQVFVGFFSGYFIGGVTALFNGGLFFHRPYLSEVVAAWGPGIALSFAIALLVWFKGLRTLAVGMFVAHLFMLSEWLRYL